MSYTLAKGDIPNGLLIDHTCYVPSCVNPDHLRLANRKQNAENLSKLPANNTSGVRGVSWKRRWNKYTATVSHNQKSIHLGYFTNLRDAEAAVVAMRNQLFTHNDADRKVA